MEHAHFEYAGAILCGMAAFKAHCAFHFWHRGMVKVLGSTARRRTRRWADLAASRA
jgi:hypothetical protein